MKRRTATGITLLLTGLAYTFVVAGTDRVILDHSTPAAVESRAALAIRDNVTPFQKWGSKNFTAPYLDRYYDRAWYFTANKNNTRRQEFISALDEALQKYETVDLYLLAHSNWIVTWIDELAPEKRTHLRLVYNTGCGDATQGPRWLDLGAKAYIGHPGTSLSPIFYTYFLRRWTRGGQLEEALETSNLRMQNIVNRLELISLGILNADKINRASTAYCQGEEELYFDEQ